MKEIRLSIEKALHKTPPIFSLLSGLVLAGLGVLFITHYQIMLHVALGVVLLIVALNGVNTTVQLYTEGKRAGAILAALAYLLSGFILFISARFWGLSIVRIYGLWMILVGGIRAMICLQCIVERLRGVLRHGLYAFFSISLGIRLLLSPEENLDALMALLGLYLLLMALMTLLDAFFESLNADDQQRIHRRPRLALPVFISALIPRRTIDRLNALLASPEEFDQRPAVKSGDLEILVHVSESGFEAFGHVDICYQGKIYSYGAYDHHASILAGAISDGVFIVADRAPYLQHRLRSGELMTGFTMDLNEAQKDIIDHQLAELFERLTLWQSDAEKEALGLLPPGEYTDYASRLYADTGARMYKVTRGKFKRYFVVSTNCVALADYLVGPSGLDMRGIRGIITPGSYYSMLEGMFLRGNTMVTAKNIYRDLPAEG